MWLLINHPEQFTKDILGQKNYQTVLMILEEELQLLETYWTEFWVSVIVQVVVICCSNICRHLALLSLMLEQCLFYLYLMMERFKLLIQKQNTLLSIVHYAWVIFGMSMFKL
jgi:hypothetical protein